MFPFSISPVERENCQHNCQAELLHFDRGVKASETWNWSNCSDLRGVLGNEKGGYASVAAFY